MASGEMVKAPRRVAIVGGGISGLAAAWGLHHHPDRFDFRLFEARDQVGGNAITADMPQADGNSIPFDISVTACIPSVYDHIVLLLEQFGIELLQTRFSYSVKYAGQVYAHDFDSDIREELRSEIARFQRLLRRLHWFGALTRSRSKLLNALNPFNYISMGTVLNLGGFSADFRYKVLKPMFVNFLMATNVFDMPAALFTRYLEFFDIESATPMQTWDQGTRRIYEQLSAGFREKIHLSRPVRKVYRRASGVVVEDEDGVREAFDDVIFACNANQTLMMLDRPTLLERHLLSSIRYDSELHNHAIVHSDSSVLPDNEVKPLTTRSNHIEQYGARPDNYEITYIMHNQQPWANAVRQALPGDLQPDQPHRRREDRQADLVPARRPRRAPRRADGEPLPLHPGQAPNLALRRPHADQQPGNLLRHRARRGEAARGGLPLRGRLGAGVVQLLRQHPLRLAIQEGVAPGDRVTGSAERAERAAPRAASA